MRVGGVVIDIFLLGGSDIWGFIKNCCLWGVCMKGGMGKIISGIFLIYFFFCSFLAFITWLPWNWERIFLHIFLSESLGKIRGDFVLHEFLQVFRGKKKKYYSTLSKRDSVSFGKFGRCQPSLNSFSLVIFTAMQSKWILFLEMNPNEACHIAQHF